LVGIFDIPLGFQINLEKSPFTYLEIISLGSIVLKRKEGIIVAQLMAVVQKLNYIYSDTFIKGNINEWIQFWKG